MATTTTINQWLDTLSQSIVGTKTKSGVSRQSLQNNFKRKARRAIYARANPFEVEDRLAGLEEKFQILSLDALSDALHSRRLELEAHQNLWLPDVLDLLLRLAGNSAQNERLLELYAVPRRVGTPPPLTWREVIEEDPIDTHDNLWQIPAFRDDDSGFEDGWTSGQDVSTTKIRKEKSKNSYTEFARMLYDDDDDSNIVDEHSEHTEDKQIFDVDVLRQCLLLMRGLSSTIATQRGFKRYANIPNTTSVFGKVTLSNIVTEVIQLRFILDRVEHWLAQSDSDSCMQAMQDRVAETLQRVYISLDILQTDMMATTKSPVISPVTMLHAVSKDTEEISHIWNWLRVTKLQTPAAHIDSLLKYIEDLQLSGHTTMVASMTPILLSGLTQYLVPFFAWIEAGKLFKDDTLFPVVQTDTSARPPNIWQRYELSNQSSQEILPVLQPLLGNLLICGKIALLSTQLSVHSAPDRGYQGQYQVIEQLQACLSQNLPVMATLVNLLTDYLTTQLMHHTNVARLAMRSICNLESVFNVLDMLYLGCNTIFMEKIELRVFDRVDRCQENWNDKYLISDMLEEAFSTYLHAETAPEVLIHSKHTSSRSMQRRRRSVRILNGLAHEYVPPWPVNIIFSKTSMTTYMQVGRLMTQLRRSKHLLGQTRYLAAPVSLASMTTQDQRFVQILSFELLTFVGTVYSVLVMSVLRPQTVQMRRNIQVVSTIDDMIQVHAQYIDHLSRLCFISSKSRVLRESLITLLDCCVRFVDVLNSSTSIQSGEHDDDDVNSFTSARSRRRQRDDTSDEDSDMDDMEGYSTFIVLDDDTSVIEELHKLRNKFHRELDFFVAGLRGVAQGQAKSSELEVLADELTFSLCRTHSAAL